MSLRIILPGLLVLLMISACAPSAGGSDETTPTAALTATSTPTIVWFPPTPTPIPQPTATPAPTQELKPGIGPLLFSDSFSSEENWPRQTTVNGNIIAGGGALTLSVQSPKAFLQTFRTGTTVDNFYAEVTATVNLCKGDDMVGILFRTNGENSYYRYLIDCNGRTGLQVVIGGTPTFLQDWTASGELLAGLPIPVKLGVWASRDTMRFFINDQFQFEVIRGTFISGGIGFYARAAGDPPLSVSFSNLSVYAVTPQLNQTQPSPIQTTASLPAP